jgi:hypothetical protein
MSHTIPGLDVTEAEKHMGNHIANEFQELVFGKAGIHAFVSKMAAELECRERQLSEVITEWTKRIRQVEELVIRANAAEAERDSLREQVERLTKERDRDRGSRVHTQKWYASHYGRLEDWARKVLPEPYRNQFFSCIANGTYDGMLDVGKPYMCKAGFMVTPSGYMHMDDAKGQLILDQTLRAEDAEAQLSSLQSQEAPERCNCRAFCLCSVSEVPHCHYCKSNMEPA